MFNRYGESASPLQCTSIQGQSFALRPFKVWSAAEPSLLDNFSSSQGRSVALRPFEVWSAARLSPQDDLSSSQGRSFAPWPSRFIQVLLCPFKNPASVCDPFSIQRQSLWIMFTVIVPIEHDLFWRLSYVSWNSRATLSPKSVCDLIDPMTCLWIRFLSFSILQTSAILSDPKTFLWILFLVTIPVKYGLFWRLSYV